MRIPTIRSAGCATTTVTRTETAARSGRGLLLGTSALLCLASAAATIHWSRSMAGGMSMPGGWTMSMVWMPMAGQTWAGTGGRFVAMWLVMMVASILPATLPVLAIFRRNAPAAMAGVAYFSV